TPGVEDWGLLLVPADLRPGERRPAIVCMHGASSDPADLIETEAVDRRAGTIYRSYAARLAARGFVVFAPAMPNNTGGEPFRRLQRKASPLGLSIFSLVAASQGRAVAWLRALPFVDSARTAYYGMSYGGMAALRVPVMIGGFTAVVCSGHFTDAVRKMTSIDGRTSSVVFNVVPEMIEWNLAPRFGHAEMAALVAPRAFMVEHGTTDRVAPVEWVAAEFARVRGLYARLGVPERAAIHTFEGGHTVMGTEAFAFLHRELAWPAPASAP
ncbi:MAG: prolyl oligopeptidase family serine peptidase, partial [Opitutaceae bacterium]|nr:prolyl oligopeptidase family serine peptidase [Opitutaceae bacterium]